MLSYQDSSQTSMHIYQTETVLFQDTFIDCSAWPYWAIILAINWVGAEPAEADSI